MALKKSIQDEDHPNGTPVENKLDKPFLLKTDLLIHKKLATINLQFSSASPIKSPFKESTDLQGVIMEAVDCFKKELLLSHMQSILLFYEYCFHSLEKFFIKNVDYEKMMKSNDLMMISLMAAGFRNGLIDFSEKHGKISNPDQEYLQETIPTLFNETEFKEIIDSVVYLLKEFSNQAEKAYQWLIEDIEPAKNQMDALIGFVKNLQKVSAGEIDPEDSRLKGSAKKVIEECLEKNNGHRIHVIQAREEFGLFTPDKEFLLSIFRILKYLDILSYGKFIKVPTDDPSGLKFRYCEFQLV